MQTLSSSTSSRCQYLYPFCTSKASTLVPASLESGAAARRLPPPDPSPTHAGTQIIAKSTNENKKNGGLYHLIHHLSMQVLRLLSLLV